MTNINSNKHLTEEERGIIETGIRNGSTKKSIADLLGKDKSTIGKEILNHRFIKSRFCLPLECTNYAHCKYNNNCSISCPSYNPFSCNRRDRSPGACNGCPRWQKCRYTKYWYDAHRAHKDYQYDLVDSRSGVNLTSSEAKTIADIVSPLLKNGVSPFQIVNRHPELGICERTLYNYIETGVLENLGVKTSDLRRQVSRKLSKKDSRKYKKRENRKYILGRTYNDYTQYVTENPNVFVTEMDTVYNDESNGPFIQTFLFVKPAIFFAVVHDEKTASAMRSGVDFLEGVLGPELFRKYVHVLKTDRGSEFSDADGIEQSADGTIRTRVYYCDAMRSNQKGALENKHIILRYIVPKETNLHKLGLNNQSDADKISSNINSAAVESLNGKSPFEYCEFMYKDLYDRLMQYGLEKIEADKVILKPYLLKK